MLSSRQLSNHGLKSRQLQDEVYISQSFLFYNNEILVYFSYDYIEVYDGNEELSDKLGKFCGTTKPSPFVSSGNELLLKFHSDDTVNWKGFHAVYKLVDPLSEESVAPSQAPVSHSSVVKPKKQTSEVESTGVNEMVINTADSVNSADSADDRVPEVAPPARANPSPSSSNHSRNRQQSRISRVLRRRNRRRQRLRTK